MIVLLLVLGYVALAAFTVVTVTGVSRRERARAREDAAVEWLESIPVLGDDR